MSDGLQSAWTSQIILWEAYKGPSVSKIVHYINIGQLLGEIWLIYGWGKFEEFQTLLKEPKTDR